MERRTFLTSLAAIPAAAALPGGAQSPRAVRPKWLLPGDPVALVAPTMSGPAVQ